MVSPLKSLINSGTKLWLDSIDPDLVSANYALGATGATSNPIIVAGIIKSGRFDSDIKEMKASGKSAHDIAWLLTNQLVHQAESVFLPVYEATEGDDGYVSFELDPLLEDLEQNLPHEKRVEEYVRLGKEWAKDHPNRLIKVPATPAGIDALEPLAAAGVNLNVTLIFSERQYTLARDAVWKGAQKRQNLDSFKSVYSIFVSRLDVYTEKQVPALKEESQGQVGIVNAKRIWQKNKDFWSSHTTKLKQEMIFASTGTKKPSDPAWKYVAAFAGSDIETNPPGTNNAVEQSGQEFGSQIESLPPQAVLDDIDQQVNWQTLEDHLMKEGLEKFADPQKSLLALLEQL